MSSETNAEPREKEHVNKIVIRSNVSSIRSKIIEKITTLPLPPFSLNQMGLTASPNLNGVICNNKNTNKIPQPKYMGQDYGMPLIINSNRIPLTIIPKLINKAQRKTWKNNVCMDSIEKSKNTPTSCELRCIAKKIQKNKKI